MRKGGGEVLQVIIAHVVLETDLHHDGGDGRVIVLGYGGEEVVLDLVVERAAAEGGPPVVVAVVDRCDRLRLSPLEPHHLIAVAIRAILSQRPVRDVRDMGDLEVKGEPVSSRELSGEEEEGEGGESEVSVALLHHREGKIDTPEEEEDLARNVLQLTSDAMRVDPHRPVLALSEYL